jgi:DNA repair exonuclease SbcCD ATPase subunit
MRRLGLALLLAVGLPLAAAAQESTEDRLREVLRKMTVDLRAAQDSQATLQAQLQQAQAERDRLAQQVQALNAQLAAPPTAAAPPPGPPPAEVTAELDRLRAALQAALARDAALQAGLARAQAAFQQAAQDARAKTADSEARGRQVAALTARFDLCTAENHKLTTVANDILHLYRTQSFRTLLIGSYEPLLGLKEVELQNTIQDYEDRILAHHLYGTEPAAKDAR